MKKRYYMIICRYYNISNLYVNVTIERVNKIKYQKVEMFI